jgi:acetyltransferase-like isoleucine patch superfamily enzyme
MEIIRFFVNTVVRVYLYLKDRIFCGLFLNYVIFYLQNVQYCNFPKVRGIIYIYNKGCISFGENVQIISASIYNPIGGENRCYLTTRTKNAKIILGDGARISNSAIYAFESIEIGKNVFIGAGCKIYDSDFHSVILEERLETVDTHINSKAVKIHDGVFIGAHSIILKGITMGENSIVGAGSVVSKDVPPNEIWAGNPARFVKKIH